MTTPFRPVKPKLFKLNVKGRKCPQRSLEKLPANKFIEMIGLVDDPKVTILVGPEAKAYSLSKKLLCQSSAYFSAAFEGDFAEGTTQTMTLEEEDVDAFELLMQYIYAREVVLEKDPFDFADTITRYLSLARIGDKLGILDVVLLAYEEIRSLLSHNCQRLTRCHLDIVFADDWPPITANTEEKVFERLFVCAVYTIFLGQGCGKEKYKNWPLKDALAEVPDLAHRISLVTLRKLKDGADELDEEELYSALKLRSSDPIN